MWSKWLRNLKSKCMKVVEQFSTKVVMKVAGEFKAQLVESGGKTASGSDILGKSMWVKNHKHTTQTKRMI